MHSFLIPPLAPYSFYLLFSLTQMPHTHPLAIRARARREAVTCTAGDYWISFFLSFIITRGQHTTMHTTTGSRIV